MPQNKKIVVTGAAGFIGMHLTQELLEDGYQVTCIDNLNPAYAKVFAEKRSEFLSRNYSVKLFDLDLSSESNLQTLQGLCDNSRAIIHLAAWPGVRQSQLVPHEYATANLTAFSNILETVRGVKPELFIFASSSSVYGDLGNFGPVQETQATGNNLKSFYAATKWSNEVLARQHHQITGIPTLALRFFTVYGEFGRPDMAYWTFLENILANKAISLYGETGGMRNFTYVKDVTATLIKIVESDITGFEALNIAIDEPVSTRVFLEKLSIAAGIRPKIEVVPRPSVDVASTWADKTKLIEMIGDVKPTPLEEGIFRFVNWYKEEIQGK